jgi:hypothetical protein
MPSETLDLVQLEKKKTTPLLEPLNKVKTDSTWVIRDSDPSKGLSLAGMSG